VLNKGFWARYEAWIRNYLLKYVFEVIDFLFYCKKTDSCDPIIK
jgi:hypothetical protein